MKEPSYFASSLKPVPRKLTNSYMPDDLERYQSIYKGADRYAAIGDATPFYLWDEGAAAKIRAVSPSARIIIMLRDPVERAHSHYLLAAQHRLEHRPFLRALQEGCDQKQKNRWAAYHCYVEMGLYYSQVRRYLEVFGTEQVAIFLFEDLKRNPVELFTKVARHLGIEATFPNEEELSRAENAFKMPRYPLLHELVRSVHEAGGNFEAAT